MTETEEQNGVSSVHYFHHHSVSQYPHALWGSALLVAGDGVLCALEVGVFLAVMGS